MPNLITVSCNYCKSSIQKTKGSFNQHNKRGRKYFYCDNVCSSKYNYDKAKIQYNCHSCDIKFYSNKRKINKNNLYFCSKSCSNKNRKHSEATKLKISKKVKETWLESNANRIYSKKKTKTKTMPHMF